MQVNNVSVQEGRIRTLVKVAYTRTLIRELFLSADIPAPSNGVIDRCFDATLKAGLALAASSSGDERKTVMAIDDACIAAVQAEADSYRAQWQKEQ